MESYQKIRNPKTGNLIYLYGGAYNKLINSGEYKESYLASLPRTLTGKKPKSTSVIRKTQYEKKRLEDIVIPEEILMEEILMKTDNPDFISICKSNKRFSELCKNDKFWQKMYNKYYGDSGMKELLSGISYYELFKICYNLSIFSTLGPIKTVYLTTGMTFIIGSYVPKYIKSASYMHNLEKITIEVNSYDVIPQLYELKDLPKLKTVEFKLI